MANELLHEFEHFIEGLTLVPSRGGVFEITLGEELIFSKAATKKFPDYKDVASRVREILGRPEPTVET